MFVVRSNLREGEETDLPTALLPQLGVPDLIGAALKILSDVHVLLSQLPKPLFRLAIGRFHREATRPFGLVPVVRDVVTHKCQTPAATRLVF